MPGNRARVFNPEFKLAAVQRIVAGEKVQAMAAELGLSRQVLYKWWNHYERGGPAAWRTTGRPRKTAAPVIECASPPPPPRRRRRGRPRAVVDRAAAKRIAELERKVGEQALGIDFFRRALRHVKAPPRPSDGRGAAASSRSSTR